MKVLLLAQSFPPPSSAGSVQQLANIFSALPPHSAIVVTGNVDPVQAKIFDDHFPQRIIRFPFISQSAYGYKTGKLARVLEYLLWPLTALWIILRERPQVVHLGEFNVASIAALIAKKLWGIPYVFCTYAEEITCITVRPIYLRLLKKVMRNADAITTVSDYTKEILQGLGANPDRIHKILPSITRDKLLVDVEDLEALRRKYLLRDVRVILTVGRLVERKGHATVIEALPAILHSFPATRYVVVGAGPEENKLKEQARQLGLQGHVTFAGPVDDKELACWYEACDIFVMPHRYLPQGRDTEGCPTVFLEASAHKKPVIGGKDGGVSDAILQNRTGFIIDGTNASELSENVCRLLNDTELAANMGAAGYEYVKTLVPESRAAAIEQINLQVTCSR